MNRRSFLQVATAAITAASSPFAKADSEPEWMDFKDRMPKAEEKFEIQNKETGTKVEGKLIEFYSVADGRSYELPIQFITYKSGKSSCEVIRKKKWTWRLI